MANRYTLTDEVKREYTPIIQAFIDKLELHESYVDECLEVDLSNTQLNPFTTVQLIEGLGYEATDRDDNGWQMDFWMTMKKSGCKSFRVQGTGITFELKLSEI